MARPGWRFESTELLSAPLVAGGLVHVAGEDGHVHTLDAGSGRPRWRGRRGDPKPNPYFPPLPPVLAGDVLAVTGSLGGSGWADTVLGLAAADGTQRWTYPLVGTTVTGLTADDSAVVVTGRNGLTCLDPAEGRVRWTVPPPETTGPWQASFDQPAVDDDHVYAIARFSRPDTALDGGYLILALDRSTGTRVWGVQVHDGWGATLTVGGDLVFVGDGQGWFIVLRSDTGDTAWSTQIRPKLGLPVGSGTLPFAAPTGAAAFAGEQVDQPVLAEQELHVPSRNGDVHLMDRDTGAVRRVWRIGVPALSIAVSDDLLHVGGIHGLLVAFHRDRREVSWWRRLPVGRIDALTVADGLLHVGGERHLAALDPVTGAGAWRRFPARVHRSSYPPGSAGRELTNADLPWA
ncbi:PQQ-binding-like beta-propeller repeat protein [Solwaraspora sp. WMMD406]|uniref:outer membrane protein assembly factor BamB family protein n=1 Tax=Solwaraspora sp. WMMD406 TaxID=3016095 RepID=UPI002415C429|nr:PQQ-binding-like beta-propeller repeat protein [Solwaraspora sp. WMMD406]MDG4763628.1 PQQ-binding-like beta-propeller repeat protein [Solwaraspora sp. WMMD406]